MKGLQRAPRKALILSPAASHPHDFGNRRRVYQTCAYLKQQGYDIHFLLYPMEPDWMTRVQGEAARAMRREWDSFQVIPSSRPIPLQSPAVGEHHLVDEWWDPTIGAHLSWLFAREYFDMFVVNYAFLSKAFEYAGARTVRVLETHDRFAGRKELLTTLGARIESFYTTDAEEKIALDRSDIVVAIKESEAEIYRSLTQREVIVIPFWLEQPPRAPRPVTANSKRPLRAGFIGAPNTVNISNIGAFLEAFEHSPEIATAPLLFEVAGDVCDHIECAHPQVNFLGHINSLDAFYDSVDVVVVPMTHSTGLKIKTGEALAYGKAVVATVDGFDGFPPVDEFHCLYSFAAVCRALAILARDPERLAELERRSRITAQLARRRMELGYRKLGMAISHFQPAILFVTDKPVFDEGNVRGERVAQWCLLCSGLATTIVGYLGEGMTGELRPELAQVDVIVMGQSSHDLDTTWNKLGRHYTISEIIISADGNSGSQLCEAALNLCANVTLDTWCPALAKVARKHTPVAAPDYWQAFDDSSGIFSTTALRYQPRCLDSWGVAHPRGVIVILCGPDDVDRHGLDLMLSRISGLEPNGIIALANLPETELDGNFFAELQTRKKPAAIITIGSDQRAVSISRSIAAIFGLPCASFASAWFPLAVTLSDGTTRLCDTYRELADVCPNVATLVQSACLHRSNTGWDTYQLQLVGRLSARTAITA